MKKLDLLALLLIGAAFFVSGCATTNQRNASAFLTFCATHNFQAANVVQTTKAPWFTHTESVSGLSKANGQTTISDLKASLTIWAAGIPAASWEFSADAIAINDADLPALAVAAATASALAPPK